MSAEAIPDTEPAPALPATIEDVLAEIAGFRKVVETLTTEFQRVGLNLNKLTETIDGLRDEFRDQRVEIDEVTHAVKHSILPRLTKLETADDRQSNGAA